MQFFVSAMEKKIIFIVIGCLLVVMAGCSSSKKTGLPVPTLSASQSQQINHGTTVTLQDTTASEIEQQLNQVASELYSQAKIPVMMPRYWPPMLYHACLINYKVGQEAYNIVVSSISKQAPTNNPEFNIPSNNSQANQLVFFDGGRVGVIYQNAIVGKPTNGEPSVIGGYQGWETPDSFYWESGAWKCEIQAPNENPMNDAQELTSDFRESGELKNLQAKSGKILVDDVGTSIDWESPNGQYEYVAQYQGNIADAIKIASSFTEVK